MDRGCAGDGATALAGASGFRLLIHPVQQWWLRRGHSISRRRALTAGDFKFVAFSTQISQGKISLPDSPLALRLPRAKSDYLSNTLEQGH